MWVERLSGKSEKQWVYKLGEYEIALINYIDWAKTYEVLIRNTFTGDKDFILDYANEERISRENKVSYIQDDFEVVKLKCLIKARDIGWDIKSVV